jgi:hypothetical protein
MQSFLKLESPPRVDSVAINLIYAVNKTI